VHRGSAVEPIAHRKKTIDRVSLDPCHNKEKERVAGNHFEEEIVGPSRGAWGHARKRGLSICAQITTERGDKATLAISK
jgi:hypothetical protein